MGVSKNPSKVFEALNRVRMSESERGAAQEYMAQGEAVADFIISAIAIVRSLAHGVERGIRTRGRARSAHH